MQTLASVGFVGGNPHILLQLVFPPQLTQMSVDDMSLEPSGTPATGMGRPTEPPICYQLCVWPSRVLIEILLCRQRGFQPGDGSADGLLQPVQVLIHLRELPPGITVQDLIDGMVFFYETKKHRCRVFAARQRCNSINGFTSSCGNATSFSNPIVTFLGYCDFPSEHWTRIRTNNVIERLNREIRRRTRVVGSFPDGHSALMLVCARLRHVAGTQWGNKKYMNMKHLEAALEDVSIAG